MVNREDLLTKQDFIDAIQGIRHDLNKFATKDEVKAIVKSEVEPLCEILSKFNDELSEIADDIAEIKQSVKVIARRFVSIDRVSADTAKELKEIASD